MRDVTPSLDLDALADATVTTSAHGDTHSPLNRFIALVEETDSLCGVDMNTIAPLYLRDIRQCMVDGMETEAVMKPTVVANFLVELTNEAIEACQNRNKTTYLLEDPPCGLAIFDDRVAIGVRDGASGRAICVDTDSPRVREWAEAVFESCKGTAVRMKEFSPWALRLALESAPFDVAEPIDR